MGGRLGPTGPYTLKLAINELGYGSYFHMEEVLKNMDVKVSRWSEAIKGNANWTAIYNGF